MLALKPITDTALTLLGNISQMAIEDHIKTGKALSKCLTCNGPRSNLEFNDIDYAIKNDNHRLILNYQSLAQHLDPYTHRSS